MNELAKRWVLRQLEVKAFASRGDVTRNALRYTAVAVGVACILNVLGHAMLDYFGLLPYPLFAATLVGVFLTVMIASPIAYTLIFAIGLAVLQLSISRGEYERLSRTDMLSGLLNRRAFSEAFEQVEEPASLAIFDIDRFKSINDRYGHQSGDEVIKHVAAAISEVFEGGHTVARIGGEEFAVIVHAISPTERTILVDRARETIAIRAVDLGEQQVQVTVSGGIADVEPNRSRASVYAAADRALYLAKSAGRNRIVHEAEAEAITAGGTVRSGSAAA